MKIYEKVKDRIEKRVEDFKSVRERSDDVEMFKEFVFCLLTPQSKAKVCWRAVEKMADDGTLFEGDERSIYDHLKGVRYRENKARYVLEARERFFKDGKFILKSLLSSTDPFNVREWLVKNVKGMGYKEASHFLRNVGYGLDLAILDRHILKNLLRCGVIEEIPKTLTRRRYLTIEEKMREFSKELGIPMSHLDLLLWYKEAGDVFK